ncbi:hypothetical protein [Bifidobacterium xylocopae]|uniref:Uncharacterized protein n=1 Tax=Bifidobacterium xylocopae TaxID=2493119 RepID=A0A366KE06_9BIFI|nr:hypothetical protein [Bifidobacterium xylocopae]RBP99940.1 hypothetical protein CRD59_00245 [Bifidobacterium xylocopae]
MTFTSTFTGNPLETDAAACICHPAAQDGRDQMVRMVRRSQQALDQGARAITAAAGLDWQGDAGEAFRQSLARIGRRSAAQDGPLNETLAAAGRGRP